MATMDVRSRYLRVGRGLGIIAGLLVFVASWVYSIATYGFMLGVFLGWMPSMIAAFVAGWFMVFLWGPAVVLLAVAAGGLVYLAARS